MALTVTAARFEVREGTLPSYSTLWLQSDTVTLLTTRWPELLTALLSNLPTFPEEESEAGHSERTAPSATTCIW